MAKQSSFLLLLALVFIWMLVNAPHSVAISCDDVNSKIFPCMSYIVGGGQVPSSCCSGVKNLVSMAKTKADRQTGCSCIKSLAAKANDDQLKRAQSVPKTCGVSVPFPISRDADCSKVN